MKYAWLYVIGLMLLVMIGFVVGPACTATAEEPRFVVLTDMSSAAVLDQVTGLVWEQAPSTSPCPQNGPFIFQCKWQQAQILS